jgi:hypothetical protein
MSRRTVGTAASVVGAIRSRRIRSRRRPSTGRSVRPPIDAVLLPGGSATRGRHVSCSSAVAFFRPLRRRHAPVSRRLAEHAQMAVRLEEDVAEPAHRHDALAAERGVKLGPAEPLAREVLPQDLAVPDQDRRRVVEDSPDPLRVERHPCHQGVHEQDGGGADEPAAEGVVVPDEGVLGSLCGIATASATSRSARTGSRSAPRAPTGRPPCGSPRRGAGRCSPASERCDPRRLQPRLEPPRHCRARRHGVPSI